jgi:hypothetical protein
MSARSFSRSTSCSGSCMQIVPVGMREYAILAVTISCARANSNNPCMNS